MKEIRGEAKSIRQPLGGSKYVIDYYQREYKWKKKQLSELLEDLPAELMESYEFDHEANFAEYRNHIGGLLLRPKSFNASYGDLEFGKSLHEKVYEHNPVFKKADLDERPALYRQLADVLWGPDKLLPEGGA